MNASPLLHAYQRAAAQFKDFEQALSRELDRLDAARDAGAPRLVAQAYRAVQLAELACVKAEETLEHTRQTYWNERARQVEQQLLQAVEPHLGAFEFLRRASGALVPNPAAELLGRALHQPRAPFAATEGEPPIVPLDSPVLERAEDSNVVLLRGAAAT